MQVKIRLKQPLVKNLSLISTSVYNYHAWLSCIFVQVLKFTNSKLYYNTALNNLRSRGVDAESLIFLLCAHLSCLAPQCFTEERGSVKAEEVPAKTRLPFKTKGFCVCLSTGFGRLLYQPSIRLRCVPGGG